MAELIGFSLTLTGSRDDYFGLVYSHFSEDNIEDVHPYEPFQEGMIPPSLQTHDAYMAQRVLQLPGGRIRGK